MGHIADFVPNHMGIIDPQNEWWMDVLENGPSSRFASFFDIDWDPLKEELRNKVLLPILGDQYGRVLERGEFHLRFGEGGFFLTYYRLGISAQPANLPLYSSDRSSEAEPIFGRRYVSRPGEHPYGARISSSTH